jgi:hypothetical protein
MKLRFQVSQSTNLTIPIIIENVLFKLNGNKYRIQEVTDDSVTFDDNPWTLRWSHEAIKRLDGGRFKINVSDSSITVSLHYYLNLLPWLIAVTILEFYTINDRVYEDSIFLVLFFFIIVIIQTLVSRGVAKSMLSEILNERVPD